MILHITRHGQVLELGLPSWQDARRQCVLPDNSFHLQADLATARHRTPRGGWAQPTPPEGRSQPMEPDPMQLLTFLNFHFKLLIWQRNTRSFCG